MARKPKDTKELQGKQEEILNAAVAIFANKGFSGATTQQIAHAAGVAEGTIFRYFKTKKELLTAIVVRFIQGFSGDLVLGGIERIVAQSEGKDLRVVLKEILMDRLRLLHQMMPVFQIVVTEALHHPEIRTALQEQLFQRAILTVTPIFTRMEREGILRPNLSRETVFRTILGAFIALMAQTLLAGLSDEAFEAEADRTVELLYFGLIASPSPSSKVVENTGSSGEIGDTL